MSRIQYVNHFTATLATSIGETDTVLSLTLTNSSAFSVTPGYLVPLTLLNPSSLSVYEVVYCTAVSGNSYTVIRGKEGSAQSWPAGALVKCGTTASILNQTGIAGSVATWSADVSNLIGGYSKYSQVVDSSGTIWVSGSDNNVTQPGVSGSSWSTLLGGYLLLSSANTQVVQGPVTFSGITTVPAVTNWQAYQAVGAKDADSRYVAQQIDTSTYGITFLGYNTTAACVSAKDSSGTWHYLAEQYWVKQLVQQESTTLSPIASSQSVTVPSWATRVELVAIGGGGGGCNCQTNSDTGNKSGGGGGSGEIRRGVYSCSPGQSISFIVGNGGGSESSGGLTSVAVNGNVVIQSAAGLGSSFLSTGVSAGGGGGTSGFGGNIISVSGTAGSDGQNGTMYFAGNGGNGPFGGAGRAGASGGENGSAFGAGGGGAYDPVNSNTLYLGGDGAPGLALFRFLP